MSEKTLQDMTIKDTFMFYAVMNDTELCRALISRVLDMEISEVVIHGEDTLFHHPQFHGIRMDVIAVENETRRKFNVEMQVKRKGHFGKRSRYYHSQIDMDMLRKGVDYADLPNAYVIFICDFDPFMQNLYRYTFSMKCQETGENLDDGLISVFLNTHGKNREAVPEALADLLDYLAEPECMPDTDDPLIHSIDDGVRQVKVNRTWEDKYMLLMETLKEERAEGREEGRAEGRDLCLAEMIEKKIHKNLSLEEIAEQMELSLEEVRRLSSAVLQK